MAQLRIRGPSSDRLVPLEKDRVVLGRGDAADVGLQDKKASVSHCRIEKTADGYRIYDLESANGTWINGRRVRQHRLRHGDLIGVGTTEIRFDLPEEPVGRRNPKAERALLEVEEALEKFLKLAAPEEVAWGRERLAERASAIAGALDDPEAARLRRLVSWIRRLTNERDVSSLLRLMLDSVVELTGAERGFLMLGEPGKDARIDVERHFEGDALRKPTYRVARAIAERVIAEGQAVVSMNAAEDAAVKAFGDTGALNLRSVACVPIRAGTRILGAVYLDNRFERGVFRPQDLPFLMSFADQAAVALENASLHEEARRSRAEVEELNRILQGRLEKQQAELDEVKTLYARSTAEARTKYSYDAIVGTSPAMQEMFLLLDRVTDSDVPVFLLGESGSGKELAARAIHFNGPRRAGAFISENCAAIPESLFESELFGHARGAFTGAVGEKKGLFALASGGTLFLDEIAEMPLAMQAKLLRVLQEKEVRPVGAARAVPVDVRIVTASNKNLTEQVRRGLFREDLFHRIHVIEVKVPPLRDRREDIPVLARHFLDRIAKERGEPPREIADAALELFGRYEWPGNVRELENEIRRAHALADKVILPEVLSDSVRKGEGPMGRALRAATLKDAVRDAVREVERSMIAEALRLERGNKSAVARRLGISRPTLDAKMDELGIPRYPV